VLVKLCIILTLWPIASRLSESIELDSDSHRTHDEFVIEIECSMKLFLCWLMWNQ